MSTLATMLASLPETARREALSALSSSELAALEYAWPVWARPDQLPPPRDRDGYPDWRTWLILAGRGWGKSKTAAEATRAEVEAGRRRSIGLISPTADTARRDQVKALLEVSPPWFRPDHEPSKRQLVWPNGAIGHVLTAEEPDRARGLNLDWIWADEFAAWSNQEETWDTVQFALRVPGPKGDSPAGVISTTPRPSAMLRKLIADPLTVVTKGRTFDNAANLSAATLDYLRGRYAGTSLGRQELDAELLEEAEGALWTRTMLETTRVPVDLARPMARIVVAIDPSGGGAAETGIVVAGLGRDGHGYALRDASGRYTPEGWARTAVNAYQDHSADRIVAERNYGGEMVASTIRAIAPNVPVKLVNASRGKQVRAEPVVALFEQNRAHLAGVHPVLEDQLCQWNPLGNDPSPDRLDALVWALTDLMLGEAAPKPARFMHIPWGAR